MESFYKNIQMKDWKNSYRFWKLNDFFNQFLKNFPPLLLREINVLDIINTRRFPRGNHQERTIIENDSDRVKLSFSTLKKKNHKK